MILHFSTSLKSGAAIVIIDVLAYTFDFIKRFPLSSMLIQAAAIEGQEASVVTDYVIKVLMMRYL